MSKILSFKTSPGSAWSILMAVYESGWSEKTAHQPLSFHTCMRPSPGVMAWEGICCMFLVRIDSNLDADRYISGILRQVDVPYLRGLPNAIF
ncbi:hypothetical protein TNCV_890291 [Trichonephila clavipes]|nr:hypothetical protein TNCV_890291 [Trichonephila clavipes]